jgi:peptidoglycan/LPS O-acetylase OafA/YrhL
VLLVVLIHAVVNFRPSLLRTFVPGGFLGVDVFFVLSGFLITSLLLNEQSRTGRVSLGSFYRRRALRLLPALLALLALHLLYTIATGLPVRVEVTSVLYSMFYVANWVLVAGHEFANGLQHLWSLSVEEQFYFAWPLVTVGLLGARRSLRFVVCVLGALIVAVVIWRALLWKDGTNFFTVTRIYDRTDTRADALLVGALAAHIWTRGRFPRRGLLAAGWVSAAFIAVCALKIPVWQGFYYKGGFTLIAIATAFIIICVVEQPAGMARALSWRPLRAVGRVSYGLYLWHLPVFVAVHRYGKTWPWLVQLAVALPITAAFVVASWRFVETPFLRRKNRPPVEARLVTPEHED